MVHATWIPEFQVQCGKYDFDMRNDVEIIFFDNVVPDTSTLGLRKNFHDVEEVEFRYDLWNFILSEQNSNIDIR